MPAERGRPHTDVLVLGDGPAGCAAGWACRREGLDVVLVGPGTPWRATYGCWPDELEPLVGVVPARARFSSVRVRGEHEHVVARPYAVVDNSALRARLAAAVDHVTGRVRSVDSDGDGALVRLADGSSLAARVVVDARGRTGGRVVQTAAGLIGAVEPPLVAPGECVLMDFGRATGPVPRFLYAMDLGGGVGLVEHTVLAARPAVPVATLAAELAAELALAGLGVAPGAEREAVWIDMDPPVPGYTSGPVVPFGAAAGFVHPATGYSLATSLRRAAPLAEALARSVRQGRNGTDAASAALEAIWPRQARVTRALQRYGQGVLLRLDATGTRTFFDRFFDLDVDDQAAYLSTETSPGRLAGAMAAMFRHSPWPLRVTLATQGRRRRR